MFQFFLLFRKNFIKRIVIEYRFNWCYINIVVVNIFLNIIIVDFVHNNFYRKMILVVFVKICIIIFNINIIVCVVQIFLNVKFFSNYNVFLRFEYIDKYLIDIDFFVIVKNSDKRINVTTIMFCVVAFVVEKIWFKFEIIVVFVDLYLISFVKKQKQTIYNSKFHFIFRFEWHFEWLLYQYNFVTKT